MRLNPVYRSNEENEGVQVSKRLTCVSRWNLDIWISSDSSLTSFFSVNGIVPIRWLALHDYSSAQPC